MIKLGSLSFLMEVCKTIKFRFYVVFVFPLQICVLPIIFLSKQKPRFGAMSGLNQCASGFFRGLTLINFKLLFF